MGALTERTGLNRQDIGKIDISQYDTWVEIPKSALELTATKMHGCKIKGIKTTTTIEGRKDRRDHNSNSRKPKNRCRKPAPVD